MAPVLPFLRRRLRLRPVPSLSNRTQYRLYRANTLNAIHKTQLDQLHPGTKLDPNYTLQLIFVNWSLGITW